MKNILPIITDPNPILKKKSKKVTNLQSAEIQELIPAMIETMRNADGLGLAAPQIGQSIQMSVIEEDGVIYIIINPKITASSKNKIFMEEGCLSLPGKLFNISRPEKIKVRFLDATGKECKIKAHGLLARALQHEIDHLDGILMVDRVKNKSKRIKKTV